MRNNAYFIHFELRWQGATPGKRLVGLRVVDRRGGPLMPAAVIRPQSGAGLRNRHPVGSADLRERLRAVVRVRLAGVLWRYCRSSTATVCARAISLAAPWLSCCRAARCPDDLAEGEFHFTFTASQLQAYGTFELQVLEELLRRTTGPDADVMLHDVGEKIRRKIGWTAPVPREKEVLFLKDFYAAERAYLEREQLFGKVKKDKHHASEARQNGNGGGR